MNKVILIGNLTADVELRTNDKGTSVVRATIAINNGKDENGNERPTDFLLFYAFNKVAENLSKFCEKGSKIAIRLERASLRNEFELIKRYKEISKQMMTKDNRQFVIAEIQKVMKNLNQPYQNRIIDEKDIAMIKAVTVEEAKSVKKKRTRKSNAESEELNKKIWDLYNQGLPQTKIAKMLGLSQPSVNVRLKKLKENDYD